MASLNDLRVDTENLLYGFAHELRPWEDTLVSNITDSATLAEFDMDDDVWKDGDYAEFVPDGELVILDGDHPADGNDATIRRAQRGTTAAAQTAGDVVRRNPMFPISLVEKMVNETIDIDLSRHPRVYNVAHRTLTWAADDYLYPLTSGDDEVLEVYQYDLSSQQDLKYFPSGWWDVVSVNSAISSTKALMLRAVRDENQTVYYTVKQRPVSTAVADLSTDLVAVVPWQAAAKALTAKLPDVMRETGFSRGVITDTLALWGLNFTQGKAAVRAKIRSDNKPRRKYRGLAPVRNT